MKKVILTEEQIKRMMDKLILNEQETDNKNNISDNGYKVYWLDTTRFAVKKEGDSYQLFRVDSDGNGGKLLHITQELTINPTFTMQENGWPDILNSMHDSGGNSENPSSIGGVYLPSEDFKDKKEYRLGDNGDFIRDENGKEKIFPVEIQKIIDPKTESSMDYGYYHFSNYGRMQTKSIPGSVTKGMGVITLGISKGEQYVPVYGSLFLMITPDLPTNRNLQVIRSKPGAQIILNKTAIRTKDRNYMWLRFIGQMFGEGGYDWDPNEKETPEKPKPITDPIPTPINFTVDFGGNFESGKYDLDTNYQKNINDKVTEIVNFIKGKKLKNFKLVITPGESRVPNQAPFKEPGSLAAKRGEILKGYLTIALKNALSIDPQIEVSQPIIGKTEWDPKLGKDNDVYKKDQFVRVSVVIAA
jgi:hypothetical protein